MDRGISDPGNCNWCLMPYYRLLLILSETQRFWHRGINVLLCFKMKRHKPRITDCPFVCRHWGKWEEHLHQTDEDYPRHRLLRRGQKGFHQTGLSEHLHVHAGDDPRRRDAQDPLQIWAQQGKADRNDSSGEEWQRVLSILPTTASLNRFLSLFDTSCVLSICRPVFAQGTCCCFTFPVRVGHARSRGFNKDPRWSDKWREAERGFQHHHSPLRPKADWPRSRRCRWNHSERWPSGGRREGTW